MADKWFGFGLIATHFLMFLKDIRPRESPSEDRRDKIVDIGETKFVEHWTRCCKGARNNIYPYNNYTDLFKHSKIAERAEFGNFKFRKCIESLGAPHVRHPRT